jgi:hypothetical protein
MIKHFLLDESINIILTSRRMKNEKKRSHIISLRVVREMVMDVMGRM